MRVSAHGRLKLGRAGFVLRNRTDSFACAARGCLRVCKYYINAQILSFLSNIVRTINEVNLSPDRDFRLNISGYLIDDVSILTGVPRRLNSTNSRKLPILGELVA